MKVQEYQRTEKTRPLNAKPIQFGQDRRGEIYGEALSNIGSQVYGFAEKMAEEAADNSALEAQNKLSQWARENRPKYAGRLGKNAAGVADDFRNDFTKQYESVTKDMNGRSVKKLQPWYSSFSNAQYDSYINHEFKQNQELKTFNESNAIGEASGTLAIAMKTGDAKTSAQSMETIRQVSYSQAERLGVSGEELFQKNRSAAYLQSVEYGIKAKSDGVSGDRDVQQMKRFVEAAIKDKKMNVHDGNRALAMLNPLAEVANDRSAVSSMQGEFLKEDAQKFAESNERANYQKIDVNARVSQLMLEGKTNQAQMLSSWAKTLNDTRTASYASMYQGVVDEILKGKRPEDVTNIQMLKEDDRNLLLTGGARKYSRPDVLESLRSKAYRGDLSQADLNEKVSYLARNDFMELSKIALKPSNEQTSSASTKYIGSEEFEQALVRTNNQDIYLEKGSSKQNRLRYDAIKCMVNTDLGIWASQHPNERMRPEERSALIRQSINKSSKDFKTKGWIWDDERYWKIWLADEQSRQTGNQSLKFPREDFGILGPWSSKHARRLFDQVEKDYFDALQKKNPSKYTSYNKGMFYVTSTLSYYFENKAKYDNLKDGN